MNPTIHGTCIAIADTGVLIRGPSGSGKSMLALTLILDAPRVLAPAELVADDRVLLERDPEDPCGLIARPPERLAGLIEARGLGLRRMPFRPMVRLKLVLDLAAADAERLPEPAARHVLIDGCRLPRIAPLRNADAALLLAAALASDDYEN